MNVPACPIPIHHTKFTIAKPQATGILMPQMPTPLAEEPRHRHRKQHEEGKAERKTRHTRRVADVCSGIEAIDSVTES